MNLSGILPLVSIITPVHNGSEYLDELIQSVLRQDYPNIEHLIIDDGSQDDGATLSVLRKYPHLRWQTRENKGQYQTMNEGLLTAKGDFVCFVSADDLVVPGAVNHAVEYLVRNPGLDGVFGITNRIDKNGLDYPYLVPFRKFGIAFYPYFAHIAHCSLFVRKLSLYQHKLFFNPSLRFVGDYDWIVRMYMTRLKIGFINEELSKVRIHKGQTSQKYKSESLSELRLVLNTYKINMANYFIFSNINLLLIRIWKTIRILRRDGLLELIKTLSLYFSEKKNSMRE